MKKENDTLSEGWNLENSYSQLPSFFFSILTPNPVNNPELIILNHSLTKSLGLNVEELESKDSLAILSGSKVPPGSVPLAEAYAGHQFGHFTMLGDGRTMLLGEQITPQNARMDIQLKGSGRTPYSRGGDGRAALGPMLREYIISEGMHHLGIPTTRSLAVVTTGESIMREKELQGAVLTRIAASHLRIGTFEYASNWGSKEALKKLANYGIKRHFSELKDSEKPYLSLLKEVIRRQASLISKWQLVGFIHGVMNTDNMTISGETIDYGPCAFMDTYDPATVFSSIDTKGRYSYENQPMIGEWNLIQLASSLVPLLHHDQNKAVDIAQQAISDYATLYKQYWLEGMRKKLGLLDERKEDENLIKNLLQLMKQYKADYTNTFLGLTFDETKTITLFQENEFINWKKQWEKRRNDQQTTNSFQLMKESNPAVIPRNHRVEEALYAAVEKEDFSVMQSLLSALSSPYDHTTLQKEYASLPPKTSKCYRTYCGT